MRSVLRMERPMAPPPADYPGHFFNGQLLYISSSNTLESLCGKHVILWLLAACVDVKQALIGVGMISKSAQTGYESLDKG
jgi:hypothetical protein